MKHIVFNEKAIEFFNGEKSKTLDDIAVTIVHKDTLEQKDKEIERLNNIIKEANNLLQEILVVEDWEHKGRFRPVKNTSRQDVFKIICKLNELLETPRRINYDLLKGSDKE